MKALIPIITLVLLCGYWTIIYFLVLKKKSKSSSKSKDSFTLPQPLPTPSCNCRGVPMPVGEVSAEISDSAPYVEPYCKSNLSADMSEPCRGRYPIDFPVPSCEHGNLDASMNKCACIQNLKYKLQ